MSKITTTSGKVYDLKIGQILTEDLSNLKGRTNQRYYIVAALTPDFVRLYVINKSNSIIVIGSDDWSYNSLQQMLISDIAELGENQAIDYNNILASLNIPDLSKIYPEADRIDFTSDDYETDPETVLEHLNRCQLLIGYYESIYKSIFENINEPRPSYETVESGKLSTTSKPNEPQSAVFGDDTLAIPRPVRTTRSPRKGMRSIPSPDTYSQIKGSTDSLYQQAEQLFGERTASSYTGIDFTSPDNQSAEEV